MQILVCQHGNRHRYAIPRMLEKEGLLSAFYTDSSAHSTVGRLAGCLKLTASAPARQISKRVIQDVPKNKIMSSDYQYWIELWETLTKNKRTGISLYQRRHQLLSKIMISQGLHGADTIYSMYHENLDFVRWAKQKGLKSVVDVFISPVTDQIVVEESKHFPEWGCHYTDADLALSKELWSETAALADILLCPSEWVADGVRKSSPDATNKIRVVPYGCSIDYQGVLSSPVPGRVLFAGGNALRKGLHYLAQATTLLQSEIPELDVRVAGHLPDSVINSPICKNLHFLGKLTPEQMKVEYLSADVFVLPSLSEGFAGVAAEAIGAGCPVVVTRESGTPVTHGREGLIVPSKNEKKLREAIMRIIKDRSLRSCMSNSCTEQASFYSEEEWSNRLINALT